MAGRRAGADALNRRMNSLVPLSLPTAAPVPVGADKLAPAVDGMLSEQLTRLKARLDH
jgi:hypothetical protein